jgi:hypothetical protein
MKNTIICDLDGTLADCTHRRHYVESKPKDWDAFYAGVGDDPVNFPVLALLHKCLGTYDLHSQGVQWEVVFCTGRPERCRDDTEVWLHKYGFEMGKGRYTLLMRKDGDYRADYIVKQEILDNRIGKHKVLFVLDDRQQVVDMWRRNGLVCFQVAKGDF